MQLRVLIQGQDDAMVAGHHTSGCSSGTSISSVWGEQTGPSDARRCDTRVVFEELIYYLLSLA
jgi:hypothetical protein